MTYIAKPLITEIGPGLVSIERAGCIRLGQRNSWGGPYWHINAAHCTTGFVVDEANPLVELSADNLTIIVRSAPSGFREEVLAVCAAPDESMARQNLTAGGSGGIGITSITVFKTVLTNGVLTAKWVNPRSASEFPSNTCNIWLSIKSVGFVI